MKLQEHQQRAVEKSQTAGGGMILNWGLGSGKTIGSVAIAEKKGGNVLVVTPASLRTNFNKQLGQFLPPSRQKHYTVISYVKFRRDPHAVIDAVKPTTVIADEFHRLRNSSPREPFDAVRNRIPFLVGLTGSLINNRPEEVVPLVNLAAGKKVFEGEDKFREQFIDERRVNPGFWGKLRGAKPGIVEGMKNPEAFKQRLAPVVDRFTGTAEYSRQLPRVVEERVEVVMTPEQESMYKALSTRNPVLAYKMRHNLPPSKKELRDMNAFLTAARQIMNNPREYTVKENPDVIAASPKFQRMVADAEGRAKADANFRGVIYSNFLASGVEPLANELNRRGVKTELFTGELDDKERQAVVDNLNRGRTKIVGLSPAGGEGLDLKGVKLVQLTEEHWNPERGQQAVGRSARFRSHAHLPEAERQVDVKRYLATHRPTLMNRIFGTKKPMSADEWIDARRREKLELNQQFLRAMGDDKKEDGKKD